MSTSGGLTPFDSRYDPRIRRARIEDLPHLGRIAHDAKRHWKYPEQWIAEWHDALTVCRDDLTNQRVLVAESDGRVVGFCAVLPNKRAWSLEHMWVHPASIGRGVGHALFAAAVEQLRSEGGTTLEIESDPNAEGFYRRMGATRVDRKPAPVGGNERFLPVLQISVR